MGYAQILTRPYHSEVERFHRFLNELLATQGTKEWTRGARAIVFTYNNGVHSSTGYTPYFLMHGRHPNIPLAIREGLTDGEPEDHGRHENHAQR